MFFHDNMSMTKPLLISWPLIVIRLEFHVIGTDRVSKYRVSESSICLITRFSEVLCTIIIQLFMTSGCFA